MKFKHAAFLTASSFVLMAAQGAHAQTVDDEPGDTGDVIVVTASPLNLRLDETIVGTSVITNEQLRRNFQNTLAETIATLPGVSSTYFGPAASRPVIRGLADGRIRVLDNGIGSIDASVTSPDHAVAIDPASAAQIEVIRGPATLLYGSSASGGVVNVISGKIPTEAPEDGFEAGFTLGTSTADDGTDASGNLDFTLAEFEGGSLVLHADGFYREASDYEIPGFAESAIFRAAEEAEEEEEDHSDDEDEEEEEEAFGLIENSFYKTGGVTLGLSWVGSRGYFGVSTTMIESEYGLAGGKKKKEEDEEDENELITLAAEGDEEEELPFIDLEQRRIDFAGAFRFDGWIEEAKVRVGFADYEHTEFEAVGEPGTVFTNMGAEGRLELVNRASAFLDGELRGAQGIQFRVSEFSAIGEEAFVPPTDTTEFGIFVLREYSSGPLRVDVGARLENTEHENTTARIAREFTGFSVSGGVGVDASENVFVGVNAFRTERAPSSTELFANGPHLATNAFEVGDVELDEEVGTGIEGIVRFTTERAHLSGSVFYTSYDNFIILDETGEEEDELPVFAFTADEATLSGFEAEAEVDLFRVGNVHIHGDVGIDYVRATRDGGADEDLPRIPPLSTVVGLDARHSHGEIRFEVQAVAEQDDVAEFELPTDGYQLVNLYATYRPFGEDSNIALRAAATNLTDEDARVHASFRKDTVPLRGRNFRLSISAEF